MSSVVCTAPAGRWPRSAPTAANRPSTWALPPARPPRSCSRSTTTGARRRSSPAGPTTTPTLVDHRFGRMDSLPFFRTTIATAGLEDEVDRGRGRVGDRGGHTGSTPLGLLFIDGGHSDEPVTRDYEGWAPHLVPGGVLIFHDVYPDPSEGRSGALPDLSESARRGLQGGPGDRVAPGPGEGLSFAGDPARWQPQSWVARSSAVVPASRKTPLAGVVRDSASAARITAAAVYAEPLVREVAFVHELPAGPVGAVGVAQVLHLGEDLQRPGSSTASRARTSSHDSAPVTHGWSSTHLMPRPGTAKRSQSSSRRRSAPVAAQRAAEDRVVPVHREAALVGERLRVFAQHVAQPVGRQFPVGLRIAEAFGEAYAAAQALVDRRAAGQQRVGARGRLPDDLAAPGLQAGHEVEGPADASATSPGRTPRRR